jgi:hypothetical protein
LELTRLPVEAEPTTTAKGKGKEPAPAESKEPAEAGAEAGAEGADKPKRFFDSLRDRFRKKDGHE